MKKIKYLRLKENKTQQQIATFLDITQQAYARYESEKRQIPTDILIKLSNYYNVSLDYLIIGKESNTSNIDKLFELLSNDEQNYIKGQIIGLLKAKKDNNINNLIKSINL